MIGFDTVKSALSIYGTFNAGSKAVYLYDKLCLVGQTSYQYSSLPTLTNTSLGKMVDVRTNPFTYSPINSGTAYNNLFSFAFNSIGYYLVNVQLMLRNSSTTVAITNVNFNLSYGNTSAGGGIINTVSIYIPNIVINGGIIIVMSAHLW